MPRTRGVLDSSPVDIPPVRRPPPKRSASLASLPTPPRTTTKRKRAHSRVTDSDTEDEPAPALGSGDEPAPALGSGDESKQQTRRDGNGALLVGNKKRKTLDAIAEEISEAVVEEAFWLDAGDAGTSAAAATTSEAQSESHPQRHTGERSRSLTRSPSSSPAVHLFRRSHTGLASPPPSRRQRTRIRPVTPEPSTSKKPGSGLFPKRDSPSNPFLVSPDESPATPLPERDASPTPRTPKKPVEKPTMTWVFRGKRMEFLNPHYHGVDEDDEDEDEEANAHCLLPESHPDYSPPATYAPKLLFPEAHKRARRRTAKTPEREAPKRKAPALKTPSPKTPSPERKAIARGKAKAQRAKDLDSDSDAGDNSDDHTEKVEVLMPSAETEAAVQAAMEARLAKRISAHLAGPAPLTRMRTRSQAVPRLPDSDLARRAMGPTRRAKGGTR